MKTQFTVHIDSWAHGAAIPAQFAFGRPGTNSPFAPSDNISPAIRWSDAPAGTRSFAIICHDPDVKLVLQQIQSRFQQAHVRFATRNDH